LGWHHFMLSIPSSPDRFRDSAKLQAQKSRPNKYERSYLLQLRGPQIHLRVVSVHSLNGKFLMLGGPSMFLFVPRFAILWVYVTEHVIVCTVKMQSRCSPSTG
jgi:hypothetical protein